jgi:hypothetical protein
MDELFRQGQGEGAEEARTHTGSGGDESGLSQEGRRAGGGEGGRGQEVHERGIDEGG